MELFQQLNLDQEKRMREKAGLKKSLLLIMQDLIYVFILMIQQLRMFQVVQQRYPYQM